MGSKQYTLMHKNIKVVDFKLDAGDIIEIDDTYDMEHLPVGIGRMAGKPIRSSMNRWWNQRSIPASRCGLREGLEILGVSDRRELLDRAYGLSLSDHYWIKPVGENLKWDDINFFDNSFSDDVGNALFGVHPECEGDIDYISPCSASDGWLKKKWKIINGERVLLKTGSEPFLQEPFNELIATAVHRRLKMFPYTEYSLLIENRIPYCMCRNFVGKDTELVPAVQLLNSRKKRNDVSYYDHLINLCEGVGIGDIRPYLDYMITTDYLIANTDRHYNNFGFLRNAGTLEYIGVAPVYDSGTSLWFNKVEKMITADQEIEAQPFRPTQKKQICLVYDFDWLDFSALKGLEEEAREIFRKSEYMTESRSDLICRGIKRQMKELEAIALKRR